MARILFGLLVLIAILVLVGRSNTQQLATALVDLVKAVVGLIRANLS